jgi:hypothetical protein
MAADPLGATRASGAVELEPGSLSDAYFVHP